jgi:hypothetical protein
MQIGAIEHGETSKVEVLPCRLNLTTELTRGKPHHVLREFIGCISLFYPKTVGGGSPRQAAALVFLAASTRTRVIPADFLADMETHTVATLPCGVEENKKPRSSTQRLRFGVLYCFFVIAHDRRKILHLHVTRNPNALWVVQQIR